jgi:hypothetical protein
MCLLLLLLLLLQVEQAAARAVSSGAPGQGDLWAAAHDG